MAKYYQCPECSFSSHWRTCLQKHQNESHHDDRKDFKHRTMLSDSNVEDIIQVPTIEWDNTLSKQPNHKFGQMQHQHILCDLENYFKCNHCEYKNEKKANVDRHILRNHASATGMRCNECIYVTKNRLHFKDHMDRHKWKMYQLYQCKTCNFIAKDAYYHKIHVKNNRCKKTLMKIAAAIEKNNAELEKAELEKAQHKKDKLEELEFMIQCELNDMKNIKCLKCVECEHTFEDESQLSAHAIVHSVARNELYAILNHPSNEYTIFRCMMCNNFNEVCYFTMKDHIAHCRKNIQQDKEICSKCLYVVKNGIGLSSHIRLHTKSNPLMCRECKESFASKKDFADHVGIHENHFVCSASECDYHCGQQKTFLSHRLAHDWDMLAVKECLLD